jgi:3-dehydroquinate synthetase
VLCQRLSQLLKDSGLPICLPPDLKKERLIVGMTTDKKMAEGKVKFVCVEDFGKTCFAHLSVREIGAYL